MDLEEVKILRQRVMECQRREEVNHPQRCREHAIAYMTAFKKYKAQGEKETISLGFCVLIDELSNLTIDYII